MLKPHAGRLEKYCPFLGLKYDPQSLMVYISPQNHCHHCKPVMAVNLEHQNDYCLGATYSNCQVYNDQPGRPLPRALRLKGYKPATRRSGQRLVNILIFCTILLTGGYFIQNKFFHSPPVAPGSPLVIQETASLTPISTRADPAHIVTASVTLMAGVISPTLTATVSPFPSLTPTILTPTRTATLKITSTQPPSRTPVPSMTATEISPHALDVPIGKEPGYLIHRVADGENLIMMAATYLTTVEAILAVNYSISVPIWRNSIVIIPLGITSTASLPILEPYQLTVDKMTAENLARDMGCDAALFKNINEIADGEILRKGDWFLVPHNGYKQ